MRKFNLYVLFIIALLATACGGAGVADVASATCDEVSDLVAAAEENLEQQVELSESDSGVERIRADVEEAEADLEAVQARADECDDDSESVVADPPGRVVTTDFSDEEECATWQYEGLGNEANQVVEGGILSIREADDTESARAAANDWLEAIKVDDVTLSGAAAFFLDDREVDQETLFDDEGCATEEAEKLVTELQLALATSEIEPSEAPADGRNSGVDNGVVVVDETAGIAGDRTAVKVTNTDGDVVWIMARCANPVTEDGDEPDLPTGETDQDKDPSLDVLLNDDVPPGVRGEGAGTRETEPDAPIAHGVGDADGDGRTEVGDVSPEVWEDVTGDGYCQTACGSDGTSPPEEASPSPAPDSPEPEDVAPSDEAEEVGDEGSSGSTTTGDGETHEGGSDGTSDQGEEDSQGGEADNSENEESGEPTCDPFEGC